MDRPDVSEPRTRAILGRLIALHPVLVEAIKALDEAGQLLNLSSAQQNALREQIEIGSALQAVARPV